MCSAEDPHLAAFEEHRGLLTGVAYRMLGSVSDAEDMVQETWLRWAGTDETEIRTARSWLVTIVSRLCLDRLKSARVQREQYYGTWLPEPLIAAAPSGSPSDQVDESVSIALLLVLEKLSPVERAGFLLHEVFGHTFEQVAEILGKPAATCRKLVSRARARVRSEKPRFTVTNHEHEALLSRFMEACRVGEMEPLMGLLGQDAALYSDGGGKVSAVPKVLIGRESIARFFISISRQGGPARGFYETSPATFNGAPGLLIHVDGKPVTALSLEVMEGKISKIFAHRNPDKLQGFMQAAAGS
ncbi:MAG: sigma-70 family RNA polymerase sigma factor [Prosthecobacter sp.]